MMNKLPDYQQQPAVVTEGSSRRSRYLLLSVVGAVLVYSVCNSLSTTTGAVPNHTAPVVVSSQHDERAASTSTPLVRRKLLEEEATIVAVDHAIDESSSLESFSSCLMVMDDNHRLIEWIAYHYFTMNLRYLVILPDPRSAVMPTAVLDKWRDLIEIVEWTDDDYFTDKERNKAASLAKNPDNKSQAQQYHNLRQDGFLRECTKHMKANNRTWTSFHDVDEFYVLNSDLVKGAHERMEQPGSVLKFIKEIQSILEPLDELSNIEVSDRYVGPCVTTYRTLYGAVESEAAERDAGVPSMFDSRRFDTLRWRHHRKHNKPQLGKSLVDLTRVSNEMIASNGKFSPHQTLEICPPIFYTKTAFLNLNHYYGNWESYSFRPNDGRQGGRKTRKKWQELMDQRGGKSGDDARPWIQGFVKLFGEQKAVELLDGVGLDPDYEAPIPDRFVPDKDKKKDKKSGDKDKAKDAEVQKEDEPKEETEEAVAKKE